MDNDRSRYHRYNPTIRRIQTAKTREPVLLQSDTGEAFLQSLCSMEYLGPGAEDVSPQAAAGILVERLKHSGHLGDRREALDALLALSKKHPGEVGLASGMPTFTDILQAGVADGAMTQTIMEIMINLVSERDRDVAAAGGDDVRVGVNIDAFLRDVQNVQNLLDLLESQDTLTAMSAVQVLQAVQKSAADSLEASILECPAGMQALVEVLRDPREEVRNEVILLLGQLTSTNLEVKKFVAFQEGFERLFDIMAGEGMLEGGGVIVKDCLDVCLNMLAGSSLTKVLFCQSKCLRYVHQLIDVRTVNMGDDVAAGAEGGRGADGASQAGASAAVTTTTTTTTTTGSSSTMSAMQNEIACKALDLLLLVLDPEDPEHTKTTAATVATSSLPLPGASGSRGSNNSVTEAADSKRAERQSAVANAEEGMLSEMVAHVGFSRAEAFSRSSMACRERAMKVAGAMVDGHANNQYNMGELLVQDVGDGSVTLATLVMEGALGEGGADPALNDLFHWVLGCFFHGNELGCAQVVSHVIAPPPPPMEFDVDIEAWVPPTPPGKVLLESLAASAEALFGDAGTAETRNERDRVGGGQDAVGRVVAAAHAADVISRGCMILSMLFINGGETTKEIAQRIPVDTPPPSHHRTTLLHGVLRWLELATSHTAAAAAAADYVVETAVKNESDLAAAIGVGRLGPVSEAVDDAEGGGQQQGGGTAAETAAAIEAAVADAAVSLLRLLCRWLHQCPTAVRELLENPANLFVVDVAAGRCSLLHLKVAAAGVGVEKNGWAGSGTNGSTLKMNDGGVPAVDGGEVGGTTTAVAASGRDPAHAQRAAVKGLTCLMLGILLEFVEEDASGVRSSSSGGVSGGDGGGSGNEGWNRNLVMKMIQNRVGVTPFTAAIEVTKRAFTEAEAAHRRRARAARGTRSEVPGSAGTSGSETETRGVVSGALRLDSNFSPLLNQSAEQIRRRVISLLMEGGGGEGGGTQGGDVIKAPPEFGGAAAGPGLATVVEMQESEIATLKHELSEALSRVPRGGGESALEAALKKQVDELEDVKGQRLREIESLAKQLSDTLRLWEEEKESGQQLLSELEGLSVTVTSLERQLFDREADVDGLRRQLDAGADRSLREQELARQVDEARSRASKAEEELERLQRQFTVEAEAKEELQETLTESEATWSKRVEELQAALDEAGQRRQNSHIVPHSSPLTNGNGDRASAEVNPPGKAGASGDAIAGGELCDVQAVVAQLERTVAEKVREEEASQREIAFLRKAADEAKFCLGRYREEAGAERSRWSSEVERVEREADGLRRQLDNAIRGLAGASSGGNQQIEALQKELSAVREREEQEAMEWKRHLDESKRTWVQTEKRLGDQWKQQMKHKEVECSTLAEELRLLKADAESAANATSAMENERQLLSERAALVDVLEARCARLEEAAAAAGDNVERRLRGQVERDRELAEAAKGSAAEIEGRLERAKAAEKDARERLDQVQVYLSQSEEDRDAAEQRASEALSKLAAAEQVVASFDGKLEDAANQAVADLEDRDAVIAAVEDARVAQEEETARLRGQLQALGHLSPRDGSANCDDVAGGSLHRHHHHPEEDGRYATGILERASGDEMVEGEEYLDLLSEHEDLLQLLAQQEVVKNKLFNALEESGGPGLAKTVMKEAEVVVANTYGDFVRYTDEDDCEGEQQIQPQNHQNGGAAEGVEGYLRVSGVGGGVVEYPPAPARGRVAV